MLEGRGNDGAIRIVRRPRRIYRDKIGWRAKVMRRANVGLAATPPAWLAGAPRRRQWQQRIPVPPDMSQANASAVSPPLSRAEHAARRASDASLALLALIVGAITIGFSGIFVRWSETGPITTGFYRLGIAGAVLFLLPFFVPAMKPQIAAKASRRDKLWLVVGGLLFAADIAVWHPALMLTTISNATFIGNISTVFVAVGAWLIFKRRIGGLFILGMA